MYGPNQDILQGNQRLSQGSPVPDLHNDVALAPVQPEPAAASKDPLWPLLVIIVAVMIILALITTAIWIGFLGWLAVKLVKLLAGLFT